jgi:hypothetical protein
VKQNNSENITEQKPKNSNRALPIAVNSKTSTKFKNIKKPYAFSLGFFYVLTKKELTQLLQQGYSISRNTLFSTNKT